MLSLAVCNQNPTQYLHVPLSLFIENHVTTSRELYPLNLAYAVEEGRDTEITSLVVRPVSEQPRAHDLDNLVNDGPFRERPTDSELGSPRPRYKLVLECSR
jgi:hypothetical protein